MVFADNIVPFLNGRGHGIAGHLDHIAFFTAQPCRDFHPVDVVPEDGQVLDIKSLERFAGGKVAHQGQGRSEPGCRDIFERDDVDGFRGFGFRWCCRGVCGDLPGVPQGCFIRQAAQVLVIFFQAVEIQGFDPVQVPGGVDFLPQGVGKGDAFEVLAMVEEPFALKFFKGVLEQAGFHEGMVIQFFRVLVGAVGFVHLPSGNQAVAVKCGIVIHQAVQIALPAVVGNHQQGQEHDHFVGHGEITSFKELEEIIVKGGLVMVLQSQVLPDPVHLVRGKIVDFSVAQGHGDSRKDLLVLDPCPDRARGYEQIPGQLFVVQVVRVFIFKGEDVDLLNGPGMFIKPCQDDLFRRRGAVFGSQDVGPGFVCLDAQQGVDGPGLVFETAHGAVIVHHIDDVQRFLARKGPGAPAQLLGVEHLGHGGPGHDDHGCPGGIPAFIEQGAGGQELDATFLVGLDMFFRPGIVAADRFGGYAVVPEQGCHAPGMLDRYAEYQSLFEGQAVVPGEIPGQGVHDQLVPGRDNHPALEIGCHVVPAVETDLAQVDVAFDPEGPDGGEQALADRVQQAQVRVVGAENRFQAAVIRALVCGREPDQGGGGEGLDHLLDGGGHAVVGFVHGNVVKGAAVKPGVVAAHPGIGLNGDGVLEGGGQAVVGQAVLKF